MRWWLPLWLLAGCAQTNPAQHEGDLSFSLEPLDFAVDDASGADLAMIIVRGPDLAVPRPRVDGGAPDLAPRVYGDGGLCGPRINEVQTSVVGMGRYEFIELYNPCPDTDLNGWTLVYRSTTNLAPVGGNDSSTLFSWQAAKTIAHSGFLVYAGVDFPGANDGTLAGNGIADDGAIGLRDPTGSLVDSVAYGTAGTSAFAEGGAAAPAASRLAAPGGSISRISDGYDSDHNATDFHKTPPTPGMTNG